MQSLKNLQSFLLKQEERKKFQMQNLVSYKAHLICIVSFYDYRFIVLQAINYSKKELIYTNGTVRRSAALSLNKWPFVTEKQKEKSVEIIWRKKSFFGFVWKAIWCKKIHKIKYSKGCIARTPRGVCLTIFLLFFQLPLNFIQLIYFKKTTIDHI